MLAVPPGHHAVWLAPLRVCCSIGAHGSPLGDAFALGGHYALGLLAVPDFGGVLVGLGGMPRQFVSLPSTHVTLVHPIVVELVGLLLAVDLPAEWAVGGALFVTRLLAGALLQPNPQFSTS